MSNVVLKVQFIEILRKEFPAIRLRETNLKSGDIRISSYVPNKMRDKRWMQLDANSEYLSIAIDYSVGDLKQQDIQDLNLVIGLNSSQSAIKIKDDNAINISIFKNEPYDIANEEFINFLHKTYKSYLKRINS